MTPLAISHEKVLDDAAYPALKEQILCATGLAFYRDKDEDLAHRLARRMTAAAQPQCADYLSLLGDPVLGPREFDALVDELAVGETSFFRHAEIFDGLRDKVLPDLFSRNRSRQRLRIWSAGCSNGAEPYSIAIMLARDFATQSIGWDISILGTDISHMSLDRAKKGAYREWDFRGADWFSIAHCFHRENDQWVIRPEYRRCVRFQQHNLVTQPMPGLRGGSDAFDLILCRNVLIYFSSEVVQRMVSQFHDCLADGGWLLVGHAEPNVEVFRTLFETVNVTNAVLYRAISTGRQRAAEVPRAGSRRSAQQAHKAVSRSKHAKKSTRLAVAASAAGPAMSVHESDGDLQLIQKAANAGDLKSAYSACARAVRKDSMNPAKHFQLAMLAEQLGKSERAEAALRRTLYLNPDHVLAHYLCGVLQERHHHPREADRSFRNVARLLDGRPDEESVSQGDGLRIGDLRKLIRLRQEAVCNA